MSRSQELEAGLLADHRMFHCDFQMDTFIVARTGITVYGCYMQALREWEHRRQSLAELEAGRGLLLLDIDELASRLHSFWYRLLASHWKQQRELIKLAGKRRALVELDRTLTETARELVHFRGQAERLKAELGELTPERRAVLDAEMHRARLLTTAAVEMLCQGMPSPGTIESIVAFPREASREMMAMLRTRHVFAWLDRNPSPEIGPADGAPVLSPLMSDEELAAPVQPSSFHLPPSSQRLPSPGGE